MRIIGSKAWCKNEIPKLILKLTLYFREYMEDTIEITNGSRFINIVYLPLKSMIKEKDSANH